MAELVHVTAAEMIGEHRLRDVAKSRRWPPLKVLGRLVTSSAGPPLDRRIAVINEAAGQG